MDTCDACGRETEILIYVESVNMEVCQSCLRMCFIQDKDGVLKPVYDTEFGR